MSIPNNQNQIDEIFSGHSRRDESAYVSEVPQHLQFTPPQQQQQPQQSVPSLQNQQQARIDAVYNEMTETSQAVRREVDLMTEARTRFAKAALYEQIIEGMLFEGNDNVTLEVESEFKDFAESRLRVLLGIESEKKPSQGLEEEEVTILKLFAAKLLGRPVSVPRPQDTPKPVMVTQQRLPPAPPVGQLAQPKRGRGRPPGTGKHQRAAQEQVNSQPQSQPQQSQYVTQQQVPEKRVVTLPNGQQKEITIQKKVTTGRDEPGIQPKPMPSPDEMVMMAAAEGERNSRNAQSRIFESQPTVVND